MKALEIKHATEKAWCNGEQTATYLHLGTFKATGKPVNVFFIVKQQPVTKEIDFYGFTIDKNNTAPVVWWTFAHKNYGGCVPNAYGHQEKGSIQTLDQLLESIVTQAKKKYPTQVEWIE